MNLLRKALAITISASLLLGLGIPTAYAAPPANDGYAKTQPISTDYTRYPNTLNLSLTPSADSALNGQLLTTHMIRIIPHQREIVTFKWVPAYESILPKFSHPQSQWITTDATSAERYYLNGVYWDENSVSSFVVSPDSIPSFRLPDGGRILNWFDGTWFYLAKDKVNILNLQIPEAYRAVTESDDVLRDVRAASIAELCQNFEAAIAKKNAPVVVQPPITSPATNTPGLAAWYKFDGNLKDSTGNGNDGSEMGVVSFAPSGASGQALKLDGGYVKIPGSSSLNLGEQFTLSAWVKMDTDQVERNDYNTVLYKANVSPDRMDDFHYYTAIEGTHDARMELEQRSTGFEPFIGTGGVFPLELHTRWAMITWVSDGDTLYLYVDGKLNTTNTTGKQEYGSPFLDSTTATLFIGGPAVGSTALFHGQLDEVKLYSRALSGSEIKADYDKVKGGGGNVIQLWIGQNRLISDNVETAIDSSPVILNGRTLVPVRPIIEAMGGTVAYDAATRKIDLALKGKTLTLWIDRYEAIVGGQTVPLQVAPTVINGRTMLPLRFAAESLGAALEWDAILQKITLRYTK